MSIQSISNTEVIYINRQSCVCVPSTKYSSIMIIQSWFELFLPFRATYSLLKRLHLMELQYNCYFKATWLTSWSTCPLILVGSEVLGYKTSLALFSLCIGKVLHVNPFVIKEPIIWLLLIVSIFCSIFLSFGDLRKRRMRLLNKKLKCQ